MPEKPSPATKPEPSDAPGEFNFTQPAPESSRIKRRSLKSKQPNTPISLKAPNSHLPSAGRELEREAPPLSAAQVAAPRTQAETAEPAKPVAAPPKAETVSAPPRVTPVVAAAISAKPEATPATHSAAGNAIPKTNAANPSVTASPQRSATSNATNNSTASPHGTRPATLYYSSYPRKDKEASSPMKSTPTASPASSSSATATPSSTTAPRAATATNAAAPRAATTTAAPRAATTPVDYRANVERQAREQKSVGNVLAYVVYALIAFFVLTAALAGYGANVIFKQIHDQSLTVSDLDQRYAAANKDLLTKLTTTQETLDEAQAQVNRQQELILKQQDAINRLIAATNDNTNAVKLEKQARTQEESVLRARLRDVEYRANTTTTTQKY